MKTRAPRTQRSRLAPPCTQSFSCESASYLELTCALLPCHQRGYAVNLDRDPSIGSCAGISSIRPRVFAQTKDVGASDRAVRKYRRDLIPNRSQQVTASINNLHAVPASQPRSLQLSRSAEALLESQRDSGGSASAPPSHHALCGSRECFQCTNGNALLPTKSKTLTVYAHAGILRWHLTRYSQTQWIVRLAVSSYDHSKREIPRIANDAPYVVASWRVV